MSRIRLLLRRYRSPLVISISGFLFPLFTNLLSNLLESAFGKTSAQLLQLVAIIAALVVSVFALTLAARITPVRWEPVPRNMKPQHKAGLIALAGPGRAGEAKDIESDVAYIAIRHHLDSGQLKVVWLLASSAGMTTANQLVSIFEPDVQVEVVPIHDILSITETYAAVRAIYTREATQKGISADDLIADYTGGTSPMKAGMVLACANLLPLQFISGRPGAKSTPIQTDFLPPAPQREEVPPPC